METQQSLFILGFRIMMERLIITAFALAIGTPLVATVLLPESSSVEHEKRRPTSMPDSIFHKKGTMHLRQDESVVIQIVTRRAESGE